MDVAYGRDLFLAQLSTVRHEPTLLCACVASQEIHTSTRFLVMRADGGGRHGRDACQSRPVVSWWWAEREGAQRKRTSLVFW